MTPRLMMLADNDARPRVEGERRASASRGDLVLSLLNVTAGMSDQIRRLEARVAELERQIAAERDGTP